jgi:hypothetical protein
MTRLYLPAALVAALSAAIYLAAQQAPTPSPTYALIIAAGTAPESSDYGGLALDWPDSLDSVTLTEAWVRVPPEPDAPSVIRPLASYTVPREHVAALLPSDPATTALVVELWPRGTHWLCATALPGQACEWLVDGEWQPAPVCAHLGVGLWRGECAPKPCLDVSEAPRGAAMPEGCR